MAEYKQFVAKEPITTETIQISGGVYDKYWLKTLIINAPNPIKPVNVAAVFIPARDVTVNIPKLDENNQPIIDAITLEPVTEAITYKELQFNGTEKRVMLQNIFSLAEQNAQIKEVVDKLLEVLHTVGVEKGIFTSEE